MGANPPQCCCGNVGMVMLRAGKIAKNAGRYYYKCLLNEDHPGSFKWFDEWEASHNPHMQAMPTKMLLKPHNVYNRHDDCPDGNATSNQSSPNSNNNRFSSTVSPLFMSLVLILLGVVIGKLF